jgi:hypothetical protein
MFPVRRYLPWRPIVVVLLVLAAASAKSSDGTAPDYKAYERVPATSMRVRVADGAMQAFFAQLKHFAERKKLKMWKSITSPDERNFSIALQGSHLQVIAVNDAELYEIGFYQSKAQPLSDANLDAFVLEMKADLGKVNGVAFLGPRKQ